MLSHQLTRGITLCALALSSSFSLAGSRAKDASEKEKPDSENWCDWLQDKPGTIYKNKDNPYIQKLQIFGRFHWQYAYLDGEGSYEKDTRKFNYDTTEIRRFRVGAKLKFLDYFEANASINLSKDFTPLGGPRDIDYFNLHSATLDIDIKEAFQLQSFEKLELSLGKEKRSPTSEGDISSRFIKTVQRTSLYNFISTPSLTGILASSDWQSWNLALGLYSGDEEREFSNFDNGYFYTLHTGYQFDDSKYMDKSRIDLRVFINGDEEQNSFNNPDSIGGFNQKWVASLSTTSKKGKFNLLTDLVFGDNGTDYDYDKQGRLDNNPDREGTFWGVVILPSYWIIEDRLETVFRYQYVQASEKEGYRISARYSRIAGNVYDYVGPNDMSNGRGDKHQSTYLGFNYYLCGDNAKVMTGIEYDDFKSGGQTVYSGTTIWTAFRMYF